MAKNVRLQQQMQYKKNQKLMRKKKSRKELEKSSSEPRQLEYPFVGKFEKVSFSVFKDSFNSDTDEETLKKIYSGIQIPIRMSAASPAYHFIFPFEDTTIGPGQCITIPTGIRCQLSKNWMLKIYSEQFSINQSVRLLLDDGVQIVTSDDYSLEQQIYLKLINDNKNDACITINTGSKIARGIFEMYGLDYNESAK